MSKLSRTELLEEVAWLLDGGVSPEIAAAMLGRSVSAIEKAARLEVRHDIANPFNQAVRREVAYRKLRNVA